MNEEYKFIPIDPWTANPETELIRHKVSSGETLESLAQSICCTWQELAELNWGIRDPDSINWYLRHFVGCTKKAGANYIFDDSDNPGIVLLPRPIPASDRRRLRGAVLVSRYLVGG